MTTRFVSIHFTTSRSEKPVSRTANTYVWMYMNWAEDSPDNNVEV